MWVGGGWVALGPVSALAYVLGMVAPLFIMALFIDRTRLLERIQRFNRPLSLPVGPWRLRPKVTDLIVAIIFIALGGFVLAQFGQDPTALHSRFQIDLNIQLTYLGRTVQGITGGLPEWVWALFFLSLLALIAWWSIRTKPEGDSDD